MNGILVQPNAITIHMMMTMLLFAKSEDVPEKRIPDEQRLLSKLLGNYNTAARPVYNASHPITVLFGLTFVQIHQMDEVNQVLTTNVWLEQEWNDERLRWDPADYNGLVTIRIPCELIWLPDIVLYNSADDFTEGYMQSRAMVRSDGNVFWAPPAKLRSSCKIDITYFPFDDQKCKMKFGSWTYDGFQVDVTNRSTEVDLTNYVFNGEWELVRIDIVRNEVKYPCCNEPYPDVTFTIIIRRRTLYYLFNIIFPCLWLTVLSLLGFWLPPDSGEKITLGITVLLAFSVFMLLIAESMPATSEFVPLIGIYLTTTMAMTSLSIVLTVFVLQLHHVGPQQRPVPRWMRCIVFDVIARLLFMRRRVRHYSYHRVARQDETPLQHLHEDPPDDLHNCNGGVNTNNVQYKDIYDQNRPEVKDDIKHQYENVSQQFNIVVTNKGETEQYHEMVNEWRAVAHVMDRFLFCLFMIGAMLSSLAILVIKPLFKPHEPES
ncbi:unnamed protein product [Owenia fusiformis]|uniref:Uncharacterized protein n=1 Tax=Owenia fusiformis TaxID=6347 RepID=A0A8S4PQ93_OWEFU|nr:unnamed protein product [Owenia fusiformis]